MFKNVKPDTRNPKDVAKRIVEILQTSPNECDRDAAEFINSELTCWPEEYFRKNLSRVVNQRVVKDPDDDICNKVYAELCNQSPEEIKFVLQVFSGQIE